MVKYSYQHTALSIYERVKDLMKRMTLNQKVRQLTGALVAGMPDDFFR